MEFFIVSKLTSYYKHTISYFINYLFYFLLRVNNFLIILCSKFVEVKPKLHFLDTYLTLTEVQNC